MSGRSQEFTLGANGTLPKFVAPAQCIQMFVVQKYMKNLGFRGGGNPPGRFMITLALGKYPG